MAEDFINADCENFCPPGRENENGKDALKQVKLFSTEDTSIFSNGLSMRFDNGSEVELRLGDDVLKGKADVEIKTTIPLDITGWLLGLPPMQRGGRGR